MRRGVSVTAHACDAAESEGRTRIVIARVWQRRSDTGSMTMQTPGVDRQSQRHLAIRQVIGRHVPHLSARIPVDRGFKPIAVLLKQVSSATPAGADEEAKVFASVQWSRRIVTLIAHPD